MLETLGTLAVPPISDITHTALQTQLLVMAHMPHTPPVQAVVFQVGTVTAMDTVTDRTIHLPLKDTSIKFGKQLLERTLDTQVTTKHLRNSDLIGKTSMALAHLVPMLTTHTTTGASTTPPTTVDKVSTSLLKDTLVHTTSVLTTHTHIT